MPSWPPARDETPLRTLVRLPVPRAVAPVAAQDSPDTGFDFGLWRGAVYGGGTGAFTHCHATLAFASEDVVRGNGSPQGRVDVILRFVRGSFQRVPGVARDRSHAARGLDGALGRARMCLADQAG